MAGPYYFDRVKDTSTTTGTGTLTLANSAPTGFRAFGSVLSNGDTCFYAIVLQSGAEWEVGVGTYMTSGTTLARTRIIASSNSGSAVSFSSGTKDVFITHPAEQMNWLPYVKAPVNGDFSWVNQGSATITQVGGALTLYSPSNGGSASLRMRVKSAPSTPYTVTAKFLFHTVGKASGSYSGDAYGNCGILFRSSGDSKITFFQFGDTSSDATLRRDGNTSVEKWTNSTTTSAAYAVRYVSQYRSPCNILRITDDGTDRKCWFSADGQTFLEFHTIGRTDFHTPDQIGFAVYPFSMECSMTLLSWEES